METNNKIKINKLVRTARKTVALVIETDGSLTVRAPLRLSRAYIDRMVADKAAWIEEHQQRLRQSQAHRAGHLYQPGETFHYLGRIYPLEIVERKAPLLALEAERFRLARMAQPRAEQVFTAWYRRQARQVIGKRLDLLARRYGYTYHSLRISSARTRWGSCGAKGTLNFTWRLVMAPEAVIDYVIVHELVHLEVKNHSARFWEQVAQRMPEYGQHRQWLKLNGSRLTL